MYVSVLQLLAVFFHRQGAPPYSNFPIRYTFLVYSPTQARYITFTADKESYNAI